MIRHKAYVEEVPNTWEMDGVHLLLNSMMSEHKDDPDALLGRYFTVARPLLSCNLCKSVTLTDRFLESARVMPHFQRPTDKKEAFGFPYIGEIVELNIPLVIPHLIYQQYEHDQLPDIFGYPANVVLSRATTARTSAHKFLVLFEMYASEEQVGDLHFRYLTFLLELVRVVVEAGLCIHYAHTDYHETGGITLFIPGTEAEVAPAFASFLEPLSYTCTQQPAILVGADATNPYCQVLHYDERGLPSIDNGYEDEQFVDDIIAFYRKRKLRLLVD